MFFMYIIENIVIKKQFLGGPTGVIDTVFYVKPSITKVNVWSDKKTESI